MTAGPAFVLVHSPLVGPATWRPAAALLRAQGRPAVVPSLLGTLDAGPPYLRPKVDAVAAAVRAVVPDGAGGYVVAGHSGAGPLLPAVGAALRETGPVHGYLFVDAAPPRPGRSWWDVAPAGVMAGLDAMAVDGRVPPWHEWFPDEIPVEVPDPQARDRLVTELRPLPLAMFREPAPVVPGWPDAPCGYLRLSPGYDRFLADAQAQGWPTASLDARHLSPYTEPAVVVAAMLDLLDSFDRPGPATTGRGGSGGATGAAGC